jgi:biopolymer transport protein ExbD
MARSIISEGVHEGGEPIGAINVTSLVDVMFCLLIMFMVATPLMSPDKSKEVDLPAGHGEKVEEQEFLYSVISIDKQGKVFLGALPLSEDMEQMKAELAGNVKLKEDGKVLIQGDQNAAYARIVDVLVALKEADISKVGFIIDPSPRRLREGT